MAQYDKKYRLNLYNVYWQEMLFTGSVPLEYDCLYYVKSDAIVEFDETFDWSHELLTYCIRPDNQSSVFINDRFNLQLFDQKNYTFAQLEANAVSVTQLFEWSAPIDIIENYQKYLESKDNDIVTKTSNTDGKYLFYNCTLPWFGSRCQYSFMGKGFTLELFIDQIFSDAHLSPTLPACYIHLNCNRGLARLCLDWRDICDGKKDCLNGEDEDQCWKLEANQCDVDEYRCHNGQCIPLAFQNDGILNPDCMDRTDELKPISYPKKCIHDPAFRCEESSCYPIPGNKQPFACGDGECIDPNGKCNNNRHQYAQISIPTTDMNAACWQAMNCLTGQQERNECSCVEEVKIPCISLAAYRCPSDVFIFPKTPILSNHVYLMYHRPAIHETGTTIEPSYICFNRDLCTVPSTSIFEVLNYTCIDYDEQIGVILAPYPGWNTMLRIIQTVFLKICASPMIECPHPSLYRCNHTSKCISIYRLRDGVGDCQLNDDEMYINTCSLSWNTMDRFKCSGENLCLSMLTVQNGISECLSGEDEMDQTERYLQNHITIQHICDGIQHLLPIEINGRNETDETECELWKCDNSYTHCDLVWNCPKGEDELGCRNTPIICPPLHHPCISSNTTELFCLSITKINDNYMDCLGGSDERGLCRSMYPWKKKHRYHCWDRNECVELESLKDCKTEKDTKLWNIIGTKERCTNDRTSFYSLSPIKQHLCSLIDWTYIASPSDSISNVNSKVDSSRHIIRSFQRGMFDIINSSLSLQKTSSFAFISQYSFLKQGLEAAASYVSLPMNLNSNLSRNQISKYIHPVTVVKSEHKEGYTCHRGIAIYVRTLNKSELKCMCPPSTYGYYCQYQSQRVSLTVQVRSATDWLSMFTFVFLLITDQNEIESYDYRHYSSITDCILKWNIYLLYRTRPKDASKNYSVRIYVYRREATALEYRTSWHYPLHFSFLPVHRMAVRITIPSLATTTRKSTCSLDCNNHGSCIIANINTRKQIFLCRCDPGSYGIFCQYALKPSTICSCAPSSLCISSYPVSICICPLGRGGPKCWIKTDDCQRLNICKNGGHCVAHDERQRWYAPTCACPNNYRGTFCEIPLAKFHISFHHTMQIPSLVFLHLITYDASFYKPITLFAKIHPYETSATIRASKSNIYLSFLFVEYDDKYYAISFVNNRSEETNIRVHPEMKCSSVDDLFNSSLVPLHRIRRIKYYHWFCEKNLDLVCFYDKLDMCLCNDQREAVCIMFDKKAVYICQEDSGNCENGGECFQDDLRCPSRGICRCPACYHGSKCQFSTKSFSLSLDNILGYQIRPSSNLRNQLNVIKFSLVVVVVMCFIGILNGIISIMTFIQNKPCEVGSGFYLLCNSFISILIIILFALKFIILILTQTSRINHQMFLLVQCIALDFVLRTCVNFGDWLNACVAVERALTIMHGIRFNKARSKRIAKWTTGSLFLITASTSLHDPLNRHLIIDEDEQRIWCIVRYSSFGEAYNSISQILHFSLPFILNIISSLFIIVSIARTRSRIQKEQTFKKSIFKQLTLNKHLLISPIILILLAVPRLIVSLVSGCMKTDRDPWLPLIGYFTSFIPSLLIFVVFVLPSQTYKTECKKMLKNIYHRVCQPTYI